MELEKDKYFPWIKDVVQSLAKSLMTDYNRDILLILHGNIDKEIKIIYSTNYHTTERAEVLYKEITHLYNHMCLKISQHPDFQNATLSCVRLISQLIKIGLILTEGSTNSEWMERILTAIKLFPGEKNLMYDALLLVNGLKKIQRNPYSAILRNILIKEQPDFVTDPLIYMEIIFLFRRLKALALKRFKEKYTILVTKMKPPSNLISWLASLDIDGSSPYLKVFQYKKIALQLMKKRLPDLFVQKIRYMALHPYSFKTDDSEFKITETKEQPSDMFVIDNSSNTKLGNLDVLMNSEKVVTKKKVKSQTKRKRKKLLLRQGKLNKKDSQSPIKDKIINDSCKDVANQKNIPNHKKHIVLKKKQKLESKDNVSKVTTSKTPLSLNKDMSGSTPFSYDVADCSISPELNENTLSGKDSELSRDNKNSHEHNNESNINITDHKHFQNSNELITVSKKKQESKFEIVKNIELKTSIIDRDVFESALFSSDVESSNTSTNKLKVVHDVPNSCIPAKKRFSEDLDINTDCVTNDLAKKDRKKLKLSKHNEEKTSANFISCDNEMDSSIVSYQESVSEKKRKKVVSKDDSVSSDDKSVYFKKLMLKKVEHDADISPKNILNEHENVKPILNVEKNSKFSDSKEKNINDNFIESVVSESFGEGKNNICITTNSPDNDKFKQTIQVKNIDSLPLEKEDNLLVQPSEKTEIVMRPKMDNKSSILNASTQAVNESNQKLIESLNSKSEKQKNLVKDEKSDVSLHNIISITSDFSVERVDLKEKSSPRKHEESFKSYQISNKESKFTSECLSVKNVSNDVATSSKNLDVRDDINSIYKEDLCNTKSVSNVSDSAHISSTVDNSSNHGQQFSAIVDESQNNTSPSLDSIQTKDEHSLDNKGNENNVSAENSFNIEYESKSNLREVSPKSSAPNVSIEMSDFVFEKNEINHKDNDRFSENVQNDKDSIQPKTKQSIDVDTVIKKSKNREDKVLFDKYACSDNEEKDKEMHMLTKDRCQTSESLNNESKELPNKKNLLPAKDDSTTDLSTTSKVLDPETEHCKNSYIKTSDISNESQILKDIGNEREKSKDIVSEFENFTDELKCTEFANVQPKLQSKNYFHNKTIEENNLEIRSSFAHKDSGVTKSEVNNECDILLLKNASEISSSKTLGSEIEQSKKYIETALVMKKGHSETVSELKEAENVNKKGEQKSKLEINEHIENNFKVAALESQENYFEKEEAQSLDKLDEENVPSCMLTSETHTQKNDLIKSSSVHHDPSEDPIEKSPGDDCMDSDQLKDCDSHYNIINKENKQSNEHTLTSVKQTYLDSKSDLVNDVEITSSKEKESSLKLLDESDKIVHSPEEVIIDNKNNARDLLNESSLCSKESAGSGNQSNLINDNKIFVDDTLQSNDIIISTEDNKRHLSDENILSSDVESADLDNMRNLANDTKIAAKENTLQSLLEPKKVIGDTSKNSDDLDIINAAGDNMVGSENNIRDLPSGNILSPNISTCLDNIINSVSETEILVKENKNTVESLFESEKSASCGNSDQFKAANSCDNNIMSKENNEEDLCENLSSNHSVYLGSSSVNGIKISMNEAKDSLQLSLECKNIINTLLSNVENSSLTERVIDMNSGNLCSTEKFADNDSASDSDEQFIILDESNSDVEEFKSNSTEQLVKNSSTDNNLPDLNCKTSPVKAATANESNYTKDISSCDDGHKHLSEKDQNQNDPLTKGDVLEISLENCLNKTDNENSGNILTKSSLVKTEIAPNPTLSNIKKDLLLIVDDVECSLKRNISKRKLSYEKSLVKSNCSPFIFGSKPLLPLEVDECITKQTSSESTVIPSFCDADYNDESFNKISLENKNENIDINSAGSVSINNFSSAASTELFSMYRNELGHDEYKIDASSRDSNSTLSKHQEIDEIQSQSLSSNHSDVDIDSRCSSEEEGGENVVKEVMSSEECNTHSKNSVPSPVQTENDSTDSQNCPENKNISDASVSSNIDSTDESKSIKSVLPRQSLRIKNKTETKYQTNSEENFDSSTSEAQEALMKEPKVILVDLKLNSESEKDSKHLDGFVESVSMASDNDKDIASSQTSPIKKIHSATECKSKKSSADCSTTDKRYSLRHRKSNKSRDDSATLGIDLNKLHVNSPSTRSTRSRRESKYVKLLVQDNSSDFMPTKRETRSSTAKTDAGTGADTPSYNLRNRKSIIAPPKLKI